MIKIIHLISSLSRGGRERQLANILANTDQTHFPTKIVYFNERESSYIDEYGLAKSSLNLYSNGKLARLIELHQFLKTEKPDVVYTWGNGESVTILLLKLFHKFKFINGSIRHGIRSKKFSHYFRTIILHISKHIVANSRAGLKANNLNRGEVLYNGVDRKFIEPLSSRKATRLELTGIPEDIPLLLSVANLVPYKDYYSVLEALKRLQKENYSFFYLILGDGPNRNQIQKYIKDYCLEDKIHILSNVENVSDYLKIGDIFIHSSKGEGCSNAILEAMAAGMPVIASNTGGISEIVNKENGLLFEYKNVCQLKENLVVLLSDKKRRIKLGLNSHRIVKKKFTIQNMMEDYYRLIKQV